MKLVAWWQLREATLFNWIHLLNSRQSCQTEKFKFSFVSNAVARWNNAVTEIWKVIV